MVDVRDADRGRRRGFRKIHQREGTIIPELESLRLREATASCEADEPQH